MKRYTKTELSLLIACFFAYTAAYISRCNLSPSLDAIAREFVVSTAQVGLLPTCFSVPYAVGQFFSGLIADRLPGPRLILTGLLGSALVNVLFSFCRNFPLLVALWFVNGLLQSLIWTPIVRILFVHFRDGVRDRAAFFMSLTLILGYLIAWALSGLLTSLLSWRTAFLVSGLVTALVAVPSVISIKRQPVDYSMRSSQSASSSRAPVRHLLLRTNLLLILTACFANGYVRDGVANWAAKMLMDTQGIDLTSAVGIILIIPAVNFLGICLGKSAYSRSGGNLYLTSGMMYAVCAVLCAALSASLGSLWAFAAVLVGISAMAYGLNPLLTTIMPVQYASLNRVALAAGLMDAMIYAGSSLSGSFAGFLSDRFGWTAVFVSWAVLSAAGVLAVAAAGHTAKKSRKRG